MIKPKYGKLASQRIRTDANTISKSVTAYRIKHKAELEAKRAQEAPTCLISSPVIATYQPERPPFQRPVYEAPGCVMREYFSGKVLSEARKKY